MDGCRVVGLDDLETIPWPGAGVTWRPLRAALGARAFGCAAFTGDRGAVVVERHVEAGDGRGHQEVYVVLRGRARFVVDEVVVDAPAGTFLCVDPGVEREATAEEDGTAVAVFGREPDFPVAGHEVLLRVRWALSRGDGEAAEAIAQAGLDEIGDDSPGVLYALALTAAARSDRERATEHLAAAFAIEPDLRTELDHDPALAPLA
jgi:quercetin dioxygenase-like cupin family protein